MNEPAITSQLPKFDTTFFERYAKITLVDLLGDRYLHLINADRPDLQDIKNGIGIEVTRALEECHEEAASLLSDMAGNDCNCYSADEKVKKYGYSYGIQRQVMGCIEKDFWTLAFPLQRIIENKVEKVAKGFYGNFVEYDLYIFSKNDLSLQEATDAMDFTIAVQNQKTTKYSLLFLFDTHSLFVCDLCRDIITQIAVTQEKCEMYYNLAII